MSLHKSLKSRNTLERSRNVLTRVERLKILQEKERWKEGDSVFGLPKVRTAGKIRKKKIKEPKEAEAAEAVVEAAPEEAKPEKEEKRDKREKKDRRDRK